MKPLLHSFLINGPFDDPGLCIGIQWERRTILFDLGDISDVEPSRLLKVSDVFVSHTHMDHFVGFDHLLRIVLNREKGLRIYGPPGIIGNIEGKLGGYTWNLTEGYPLCLLVTEVHPDRLVKAEFCAKDGFRRHDTGSLPFSGILLEEDMFTISCQHLDHKIPSLGFALKERFHININKDKLLTLGLPVGPWLRDFKEALWEGRSKDEPFSVQWEEDGQRRSRDFLLGELKDLIAIVTEGQKISYIVDAVYHQENEEKIVSLARDSDILYCEAGYLDQEREIGLARGHLTAQQAGELARRAGAKDLISLHCSPRYKDDPHALYQEALLAFRRE
ncbi:MAG: ribonuclease Z [Nitrospirae bacterium]|nr:ribonuclease Z [Nitrospirota bacterium]